MEVPAETAAKRSTRSSKKPSEPKPLKSESKKIQKEPKAPKPKKSPKKKDTVPVVKTEKNKRGPKKKTQAEAPVPPVEQPKDTVDETHKTEDTHKTEAKSPLKGKISSKKTPNKHDTTTEVAHESAAKKSVKKDVVPTPKKSVRKEDTENKVETHAPEKVNEEKFVESMIVEEKQA